jgi:hypothetical protein
VPDLDHAHGVAETSPFRECRMPSTRMLFAAVHESAFGTKRTYRDDPLLVRFRGEADIGQRLPANRDL